MGYLDKTTQTVTATFTKRGREILAQALSGNAEDVQSYVITQFSLSDDEVDYGLWDDTQPANLEGRIIENMPILEGFISGKNMMGAAITDQPPISTFGPLLVGLRKQTVLDGQWDYVDIFPTTFNYDEDEEYEFVIEHDNLADVTQPWLAPQVDFELSVDEYSKPIVDFGMVGTGLPKGGFGWLDRVPVGTTYDFIDRTIYSPAAVLFERQWKFIWNGEEVLSETSINKSISFTFKEVGTLEIEFSVNTNLGQSDVYIKEVEAVNPKRIEDIRDALVVEWRPPTVDNPFISDEELAEMEEARLEMIEAVEKRKELEKKLQEDIERLKNTPIGGGEGDIAELEKELKALQEARKKIEANLRAANFETGPVGPGGRPTKPTGGGGRSKPKRTRKAKGRPTGGRSRRRSQESRQKSQRATRRRNRRKDR